MPSRVARALTWLVVLALLAFAGCGGGSHAPATAARTPAPLDPHAPLTQEDAERMLHGHSYSGIVRTEYRFLPQRPFKVIVGIREMAADVPGQRAFFFVGNRLVGADAPDVSAEIRVVGQRGDAITLEYVLYKPDDILPIPRGGHARVTYRWTGTKVVPEGRVPSSVWGAALSRR